MYKAKRLKVCVTGAAGRIAYSIYDRICGGFVFGQDTEIVIVLYDIPQCKKILDGLVLELNDGGYPLLKDIIIATNGNDAFKDIDVGIFIGGLPRKKGMLRSDLLKINGKIFRA